MLPNFSQSIIATLIIKYIVLYESRVQHVPHSLHGRANQPSSERAHRSLRPYVPRRTQKRAHITSEWDEVINITIILRQIASYITGKGGYAIIDPHNYLRYGGAIVTDSAA